MTLPSAAAYIRIYILYAAVVYFHPPPLSSQKKRGSWCFSSPPAPICLVARSYFFLFSSQIYIFKFKLNKMSFLKFILIFVYVVCGLASPVPTFSTPSSSMPSSSMPSSSMPSSSMPSSSMPSSSKPSSSKIVPTLSPTMIAAGSTVVGFSVTQVSYSYIYIYIFTCYIYPYFLLICIGINW